MNVNPGKTEFSEADHTKLRASVRAVVTEGLAQADVARQADVPSSTLSQYLNDKYPTEPGKTEIAAKLHKWLKARDESAKFRRERPASPDYLPLHASKQITSVLLYALEMGRLVMIAGTPGQSKTATARQFQADFPRIWYAAMEPTCGGVPTMLLEILSAMGKTDARGTPQALRREICAIAAEAPGLIIVDEAQHLSPMAIEALRAINDKTRTGIAMLGNEAVHMKVGATGVTATFAQVSSRVAQRRVFLKADPRDAGALAKAWAERNGEVIGPAEVAYCQDIAGRPGGLRNIEMTMEAALLAARGRSEPLGLDHLQGAFAQASGSTFGR
jgi:hypothetical protein